MTFPEKNEKVGAGATAADLQDAKASGPANLGNSLVLHRQPKSDGALVPFPRELRPFAGPVRERDCRSLATRNGRSLATLDEELRSGRFGLIRWDDFKGAAILEDGGRQEIINGDAIHGLQIQLERDGVMNVAQTSLVRAISYVAKTQRFNSLRDWLNSLPQWDGIPRIEEFFRRYFDVPVAAYESAAARYFWTAMVARILYPGCKVHMVPVLVGAHGTGKSSALQILAPGKDTWTDVQLTEREERLSRKITGRFLAEWHGLRGIKGRVDADVVDAFISNPFIERESKHTEGMERSARCFVLVGSTDREDFVRSEAGSGRLLPVRIQKAQLELLEAEKLQLWAEAYTLVVGRVEQGLPPVDFEEAERLAEEEIKKFKPEGLWAHDPNLLAYLKQGPVGFHTDDALRAVSHNFTGTGNMRKDRTEMCRSLEQNGYQKKSTHVPGKRSKPRRWHPTNTAP